MAMVPLPEGGLLSEEEYTCWREWNSSLPRACFVLLNPSTATEAILDPTIERQQRRVMSWGVKDLFGNRGKEFGSIEVVNACAWRSTDPEALYQVKDPVGPNNWEIVRESAKSALDGGGIVICGWGTHLSKLKPAGAALDVLLMIHMRPLKLSALKLNDDGTPCHPLYLGYELKPRRWEAGQLHEECV